MLYNMGPVPFRSFRAGGCLETDDNDGFIIILKPRYRRPRSKMDAYERNYK